MQDTGDEIEVQALAQLKSHGTPHAVLDVREPDEIAICAIADSLSVPMQQIPAHLDALPHDVPLVVLCHHGGRSRMVTQYLRNNGFENAVNLAGGIDAWARTVDPGMSRY
jgi:rhodanese-related sulfurtransferase